MNSESSKIKTIVDELLSNSLNADARDININVTRDGGETTITIGDNGSGMDEETLKYVRRVLKQPYRKDLEEYYGSLAGMESAKGGLNVVGMQVSYAEVESSKEGTTILVKRNRTK